MFSPDKLQRQISTTNGNICRNYNFCASCFTVTFTNVKDVGMIETINENKTLLKTITIWNDWYCVLTNVTNKMNTFNLIKRQ